MFLLAIQAVSWNIISGYAGYVSLGHIGVPRPRLVHGGDPRAAHRRQPAVARPARRGHRGGRSRPWSGSIVLRTRGHAFVIITIALLLATQIVAVNLREPDQRLRRHHPRAAVLGRDIQNIPFYYLFLVLLVADCGRSARSSGGRSSAPGWSRSARTRARPAAIGVNTTRYKVLGVRRAAPSSSASPAASTRTS